ncbi:MAG: hypothetical protein M3N68_03170 [Actinomycetota bacterium]|nr:hypothetical protein [Actinomycetota bacterium]
MRPLLLIVVAAAHLVSGGCVVIRERTPAPSTEGTTSGQGRAAPQAEPAPLRASSDRRLLGSLGWALLSPEVPNAVVEIDQLGGASLEQEAIEALERALRAHGGKRTVDVVTDKAEATEDVYSLEDLVRTSREHRDHSSGGETVALHVLVLPGRFQVEGVPGAAFHATAIALFPREIERVLPPGAAVGAFEAAVATHELGHTFGLVNRTGVGDFHEDQDHPGHTGDEDSVMYWAVESPSLAEVFRAGPPSDFNDADRREMERIRQQRRPER